MRRLTIDDSLDALELSARAHNALRHEGCRRVSDVLRLHNPNYWRGREGGYMLIPHVGIMTSREIVGALDEALGREWTLGPSPMQCMGG